MNSTISKLLLFSLIISSFNLQAKNYYVSTSGSNTNGLTISTAFRTIQQAVNIVVAGDTVFVANGTYSGFDIRDKSGTTNAPIVFKALGNNVLINQKGPNRDDGINVENANYVVVDGFICNNMLNTGNGVRVVTSNNCVVRNCKCDKNAKRGIFTGFTDDILIEFNVCSNSVDEHGIYVSNSSDRPIIRFNECYGNSGCGIHMNGDASMGEDGIIHDAQVYGNKIHDNKLASAINMDGVLNSVIYNNIIYNNHNCQGIILFQIDGAVVSSGAKIYNNTIIVPSDGRWGIILQDGANINTQIYNNIIINLHSSRGCIGIASSGQLTTDYNILNDKLSTNIDNLPTISLSAWQSLGFDKHSLLAGNLTDIFANPNSNDFHLKSGSQAIDKGTNLVNQIVKNDMEGYLRPGGTLYDIGAYEYGSVMLVEKNKLEDYIRISPNPAKDFITIAYHEQGTSLRKIELLDTKGNMIKSFNVEPILNIQSIPAGVYFLRIQTTKNEVLNKKVVIY